jgi:hypothetical protein
MHNMHEGAWWNLGFGFSRNIFFEEGKPLENDFLSFFWPRLELELIKWHVNLFFSQRYMQMQILRSHYYEYEFCYITRKRTHEKEFYLSPGLCKVCSFLVSESIISRFQDPESPNSLHICMNIPSLNKKSMLLSPPSLRSYSAETY